ncbi:MAG TPA: hypothetical protein VGO26_04550 [Amnibacterium sp.]|jgi:hypothetical protein|nr:hypothetical protein [Amnibacterium sp.]
MLQRIRVQWFRFTHGEDVFDAWPGEDLLRAVPAPKATGAVAALQPVA